MSPLRNNDQLYPKIRRKTTVRPLKKLGHLKVAIINFRSIRGKVASLQTFTDQNDTDIIIGSESWLDSSILSAEIFPSHFQVFRKDRNSCGGGVFIAVKDSIPCFVLKGRPEPKRYRVIMVPSDSISAVSTHRGILQTTQCWSFTT